MTFIAGETVTIKVGAAILLVKIEDASKGDVISARIEEVQSGTGYQTSQICEFNRSDVEQV